MENKTKSNKELLINNVNDAWSGFAYLLANLIEKYATEISIDDLPPSREMDNKDN